MIKSIQNPFLLKKKLKTDIKMKSKKLKPLLNICYYINIFMLIHVVFIIMAAFLSYDAFLEFSFFNQKFIYIRTLLSIPVLILWISSLIIWAKHDKRIGHFFLLFFLMGLYSPFYYRKSKLNGWI
jgi:hypothetical protein